MDLNLKAFYGHSAFIYKGNLIIYGVYNQSYDDIIQIPLQNDILFFNKLNQTCNKLKPNIYFNFYKN